MEWITRIELTNGDDVLSVDNESGEFQIDSCQVDLKENNGSTFSFTLLSFDNSLVDRFPPKKTTVKIWQGIKGEEYHLITGFLDVPPVKWDNDEYIHDFNGVDYTAKLQDILVNEAYENQSISYIVNDLRAKYLSGYEYEVENCEQILSIKFKNMFLYDCLEKLANAVFWNFEIDKNLKFRFWNSTQSLNSNTLTTDNCRSPIDLKPDVSNLVTRLRVEGSKKLSADQTKVWFGDGETKAFQFPQKNIRVSSNGNIQLKLNDVNINLGIKYLHEFSDTIHYLFDAANATIETNLILQNTDELKAIYCYEYPAVFYLDDFDAQSEYGIIERKFTPSTTDEALAKEEAQNYLSKYKKPIMSGSLQPFFSYYEPGELVPVELPEFKLSDRLKITSVNYSGVHEQYIKLNIEETMTDADLMKSIIRRIQELESSNEQEGAVEQINILNDSITVQDTTTFYHHEFLRCGVTYLGDNETIDNQKIIFGDTSTNVDTINIYPHNYKFCGMDYVGGELYI